MRQCTGSALWLACLVLAACGGDDGSSPQDSGLHDSGLHDSGTQDSGMHDGGMEDAGMEDAGMEDAGMEDSGMPDAGMEDSGMPDAGSSCSNETFAVTNSGSTSYRIDGTLLDPPLTLCRGFTYTFEVSAAGHPFAIHLSAGVTSTANRYAPAGGLTGQGVESGDLVFTPGAAAPGTLHYQCEAHAAMTGVLTIVDP